MKDTESAISAILFIALYAGACYAAEIISEVITNGINTFPI